MSTEADGTGVAVAAWDAGSAAFATRERSWDEGHSWHEARARRVNVGDTAKMPSADQVPYGSSRQLSPNSCQWYSERTASA